MKQFFKDAKGHLMTGIGYMLPLIIGASLVVAIPKLIALCFGIIPASLTDQFLTPVAVLIEWRTLSPSRI